MLWKGQKKGHKFQIDWFGMVTTKPFPQGLAHPSSTRVANQHSCEDHIHATEPSPTTTAKAKKKKQTTKEVDFVAHTFWVFINAASSLPFKGQEHIVEWDPCVWTAGIFHDHGRAWCTNKSFLARDQRLINGAKIQFLDSIEGKGIKMSMTTHIPRL